ncbi:hypothetical protein [Rhodopila sp.]|uniref:hypothetical protein n=1 Tax=Rhodopila sp. TaxID=2480087 RepID=UPI003D0DA33C
MTDEWNPMDNASPDALTPAASPDAINPDASLDAINPDASLDASNPGASLDASNPDASLDAINPDASLDAMRPDASLDAMRPDASFDAMKHALIDASDPQILKIVAAVDAMIQRGSADFLIVPLRPRLAVLRPPRPLRFARLLFYPLNLLMVRAARWRLGQPLIPRSVIKPMAEQVRRAMGQAVVAFGSEIAGRSTAEIDVITHCGQTLWPLAATILADPAVPGGWGETGLGITSYRPLADAVATLLAEAVTLDRFRLDAAFGLLPAQPDAIAAMLDRVDKANRAAMPMMVALLLDQLPEAADVLNTRHCGLPDSVIRSATDAAAELLLRRLEQQNGIESRIATGTLADAGAAAARIASLLRHLGLIDPSAPRRDRLRTARRHLVAACEARFAAGLQQDLLAPLSRIGMTSAALDVAALEAAARGLRMLETEARAVGGAATYDLLLGKATEAITADAMRHRLAPPDQLRLVEILAGSDAALAILERAG